MINDAGRTVGDVVREERHFFLVECGRFLRKSRRGLPKRYAAIRHDEQTVLMTVSKEMLLGSPELPPNQEVDEAAVLKHWAVD